MLITVFRLARLRSRDWHRDLGHVSHISVYGIQTINRRIATSQTDSHQPRYSEPISVPLNLP
ncbi:hypothetical protein DM02DRAFT_222744 [Periconia macrospinosa]|uniref:Uncharacterized protein n=1 Tax=Periconia macrospinosa TaxID=97972 RepID=A0A2V1D5W8_9PLEO|nr:hypothetical protein DM02DRAFT_222744 [Periconia macrospinosa]